MSLTTITVAFVLVAALFNAASLLTAGWIAGLEPGSAPARAPATSLLARVFPAATFESLVLTLLAALWFNSLGHGGWVLVFLLLGALTAGDRWVRHRMLGTPTGLEIRLFVAALLKYLLAGLVCVWRLS